MNFFSLLVCTGALIITSCSAMHQKGNAVSELKANLKDGYLNLGLLGDAQFSLAIDDYGPEKYPDIASFGQGVIPHIVPQSIPISHEKVTHLTKALGHEIDKIKKRLQKEDDQYDADVHTELVATVIKKLDPKLLAFISDGLKDVAVVDAMYGGSEHFTSSTRTALVRYISTITQTHAEGLSNELQNCQEAFEQQKIIDSTAIAQLEHQLQRERNLSAWRVRQLSTRNVAAQKRINCIEKQNDLRTGYQQLGEKFDEIEKQFKNQNKKTLNEIAALQADLDALLGSST